MRGWRDAVPSENLAFLFLGRTIDHVSVLVVTRYVAVAIGASHLLFVAFRGVARQGGVEIAGIQTGLATAGDQGVVVRLPHGFADPLKLLPIRCALLLL